MRSHLLSHGRAAALSLCTLAAGCATQAADTADGVVFDVGSASSALQSTKELDFGGAFGTTDGGRRTVVNPATGDSSCPVGYTPTVAYGTTNVDWAFTLCHRPHQEGRAPRYEFGGMWGYVGGQPTINPKTGKSNCDGYYSLTVNGTANVDYPLTICYREPVASTRPPLRWGGFIGTTEGQTLSNPVTSAATCPDGFELTTALAARNVDYPFSFCSEPVPSEQDELDFGGAFGSMAGGSIVIDNPATNGQSCPDTYTATPAYGTTNKDYGFTLCTRKHVAGRPPRYDFGGMWGFVGGAATNNPITHAARCHSSFRTLTLNGTNMVDYPINVCYREATGALPNLRFGGFIGTIETVRQNNPVTQSTTCPPAFVEEYVLGTNNVDYPFSYCFFD